MDKNCLLLINSWPQANTPVKEALDMASTLQLFGHHVNVHVTDSAVLMLQESNGDWKDQISMLQELGVEFSTSVETFVNYPNVKPSIPVSALKPADSLYLKEKAHFVWSC